MTGRSRIMKFMVLAALAFTSPMASAAASVQASGVATQARVAGYTGQPRSVSPASNHHPSAAPSPVGGKPALRRFAPSGLRALVLQSRAARARGLPTMRLGPMVSAASSSAPPVSISTVAGKFFPNPNNSGTFDVTPSTSPAFTQSFPVIDFNPPASAQVSCSNGTGVDANTRPFTDVIPQPDGSCTTDVAGGAGSGSLSSFEAEFQANLTVAAAGQVTFNFYSDDGWVLAMGPSNGVQPAYISGSMANPPPAGPFTGYPVVGSYDQPSSPAQNTVTVNVPAAGTYPIEVDYTECCAGSLALTLGTTYGNPIQSQTLTGPTISELDSLSEHDPSCHASHTDPVNCATGVFSHTLDDLSVPGRGLPLDVAQTYRSLNAATNGPLGYGWTDAYNMSLSADSSGNLTVHEETGTAVPFTCSASSCTPPSRVLATLVPNTDGTYTFTRDQTQDRYIFSAPSGTTAGQLVKEVDRNGYATTLTYSNGQLSAVTDPAGRSLTFAYNSSNQLTSITDPANRTVSFSYDGAGNLAMVTDVNGGVTKFTYDSTHLLLTLTDPNGGVTTNVYDSQGRVTQQTDPLGRKTTLAYTANADGTQTTTITDPNGNVETQTYQNNELLKDTEATGTPQAATWTYTYDPATLGIASMTDPNGHVTTNTWDANGNLLTRTDALNHTTTSTYDSQNDLTAVTDPNGVTSTYTYDSNGNLLSVARPLTSSNQTATTSLTYGDASHPGDVTAITDPNGHTTTIAYDANGDVTKVTDAAGDITTGSYDSIGRLLSTVSPKGNTPPANPSAYTTSLTYNPFGEVISRTDPLGEKTTYTYDADQNLTSITDPLGHVTSYAYDADNEPTGTTRADGSKLGMTYDGDGNLLTQTNGLNETTSYAYNPLDRLISTTDPLKRVTSYTYDLAGNRTSLVDALSRTTSYAYDAANRLTGISYSDGTTPNVSYTYDADGQRLSMTDGTGTSSYSYDSLNRLTQSKDGAGHHVSYGYDLTGNLTALTYPDGSQVTRAYDTVNRLASVKDWLGHTTSFAYDPNSNLTTQTYPNTTTAAFSFDAANNLAQIIDSQAGNPVWTFGYTRDATNQLVTASDPIEAKTHTYSYDALNRLTSDQGGSVSGSWTLDAAGNVTQTQAGITQSYDAASELTASQPSRPSTTCPPSGNRRAYTYSYNANGDRTQQTDTACGTVIATYGYDQANRLISLASGSTNASYAYNGDGLRMSKTVNGTAEALSWDLAEGTPLILQDGSTKYLTGPGGLPIEQVAGSGTVLYYYQDQLGSTRGLRDASGNVAATFTYSAYGHQVGFSSNGATTPFGFAGQYTDAESGFQYLRNRYYDPSTTQFLTVDPLVASTGEPYSYVGDNPVNVTDPTGLCSANRPGLPPGGQNLPLCQGWTYGVGANVANARFSRDVGRGTRPGKFGWNFYLTRRARGVLGPVVTVSIVYAAVNGKPISPPYSPHTEANTYDFHSSLENYNFIGGGHGTIHSGDVLTLIWLITGSPGTKEAAAAFVTCRIP